MIRPMTVNDLEEVVEMHCTLIGDADLPLFGKAFMKELYQGILSSDFAVPFVYDDEGEVRGFIVGTTSMRQLFSDIMKRKMISLAQSAFFVVLMRPWLWKKAWEIMHYNKTTSMPEIEAEMPYIVLVPTTRKKGKGKALVAEVLKALQGKGIKKVKVSAHTENDGPNRLLTAMGFHLQEKIFFLGKWQNLYWGDIDEALSHYDSDSN